MAAFAPAPVSLVEYWSPSMEPLTASLIGTSVVVKVARLDEVVVDRLRAVTDPGCGVTERFVVAVCPW